jgi:hypothetical protein
MASISNVRRLVGLAGYNKKVNDVIFAKAKQQPLTAENSTNEVVVFFGGDVQVYICHNQSLYNIVGYSIKSCFL